MKKLFVASLPWSIKTEDLRELFSQFWEIEDAIVITDKESGRSKWFWFVTFVNWEDADKAIAEMNWAEIEWRAIVVNEAKPQAPRN